VSVSFHLSRSSFRTPLFWSFSSGLFQGLSVCLVVFQSVSRRGSSVGFSLLMRHLTRVEFATGDAVPRSKRRHCAGSNEVDARARSRQNEREQTSTLSRTSFVLVRPRSARVLHRMRLGAAMLRNTERIIAIKPSSTLGTSYHVVGVKRAIFHDSAAVIHFEPLNV